MTAPAPAPPESLAHDVRMYVFGQSAATGRVPQTPQIAAALGRTPPEVKQALRDLAAGKVIILAPNDGDIHFGVRAHCWWDNVGFT